MDYTPCTIIGVFNTSKMKVMFVCVYSCLNVYVVILMCRKPKV